MANFQNILGVSAKELEEQFTKEETLEHLHKVYNVLFSTTNILTTALLAAKGDDEAQKLIEDLCQAEEIPEGRADLEKALVKVAASLREVNCIQEQMESLLDCFKGLGKDDICPAL